MDWDTLTADYQRDRYGRPLVIPPEGGKAKPYRRPSSFGGAIEDTYLLQRWVQRQVAQGIASRREFVPEIVAANGDRATLDALCDRAKEAAGGEAAANIGTALHRIVETWLTTGEEPPAEFAPYIARFAAELDRHNLEVVPGAVELRVVNDQYATAGTADYILRRRDTGHTYVADLKTGKQIKPRPLSYLVQLALYATGTRYDIATGERAALGVDQRTAYIVHLPAEGDSCTLYTVDVRASLELCDLAQAIYHARAGAAPVVAAEPPGLTVADPLVHASLTRRVRRLLDAGITADEIVARWPPGVPKLKAGGHTDGQLNLIAAMCDRLEDRNGVNGAPDEGPDVDATEIQAIAGRYAALQMDWQRARIDEIAREAAAAGHPISLRQRPSIRRLLIASALLDLIDTQVDDIPELIGRQVCDALGVTYDPDVPVGAYVAELTADQAAQISPAPAGQTTTPTTQP